MIKTAKPKAKYENSPITLSTRTSIVSRREDALLSA